MRPSQTSRVLCFLLLIGAAIVSLVFSSLLYSAPKQTASQGHFIVSNKVPEGFENLDVEQEGVVDVYYGNVYVGAYTANFTTTGLQFDKPKKLVSALKNLNNLEVVTQALSGKLRTHSNLVCASQYAKDCGVLTPKIAGIIFDQNRFRVDVFVNKNFVKESEYIAELLGRSTAGFSYLNQISTEASGSNNQLSYNVTSSNVFGYREARLTADVSYAESTNAQIQQTQVSNLSTSWHRGRYLLSGGMLSTQSNALLPTESILGVGWGTSKDTLPDDGNLFSSPMEVFLPVPSRISVYYDGRLISSQFYQAGKQLINTANFPDGSYTVTLRIETQSGQVTEEQRPFVRTGQIPPLDYPSYYMNIGYLQGDVYNQGVLPKYTDTLLFQLGGARRMSSSWGMSGMAIGEANNYFASTGLFFIHKNLQVNPEIMVGNHGETGVALNFQSRIFGWNTSLYANKIWAYYQNSSSIEPNLPVPESNYSPIVGDSMNGGGSLSTSFGKLNVSLNANINQQSSQQEIYSYGSTLRLPLQLSNGLNLSLETSLTETQNDTVVLGSIRMYLNPRQSPWTNSATLEYRHSLRTEQDNTTNGLSGSVNTTWQKLDQAQEGLQLGVSADYAYPTYSASINGSYDWDYGDFKAQAQQNDNASTQYSNTQYSLGFNTRLAYASSKIALTGGGYGQTGVLVDVRGNKSISDRFEVIVDNQVRKIVSVNTPTLILLTPFESYKVRIQAIGQSLFEYREAPYVVTLYKGNVKSLNWDVSQKMVLFTKIVYPNGKPVVHKIVRGGIGINETNVDGSLQLEIVSSQREFTVDLGNKRWCKIRLPEYKNTDGVALLNDLVCKPNK